MVEMIPMESVSKSLEGLGFDRIQTIHGSTYKDNSTIIIVPTRGMVHYKVVQSWQALISPMNQKRAILFAVGEEVGLAYNTLVQNILNNPELSKWQFVMVLEDDNIVPPDAHIRLLESIRETNADGVSGIYFTKGDINMPQAYGNPEEYRSTGVLDFKPLDIRNALQNGGNIMEVNGIAMGCALFKMDLFKEIKSPWFVTVNDFIPDKGVQCFTQDLYFCKKAKEMGKRFYVDFRVKVGHIDTNTGIVY